jgi:hypothetical protein
MGLALGGVKVGQGARPFFVAKLMQFPGVALLYVAMLIIAVPLVGGAMTL